MPYLRFSIPEFDYTALKGMSWTSPTLLVTEEVATRIKNWESGEADSFGCDAIDAPEKLFEMLNVRGDHCHAVMCITPSTEIRILGRSYAWWNQRVIILDSIDPNNFNILFDWRTPRPMNTRLGPENGVVVPGGVHYVIACHMFDDHWVANRTITDNEGSKESTASGFRVLGASKDDADNFCECCLSFTWKN